MLAGGVEASYVIKTWVLMFSPLANLLPQKAQSDKGWQIVKNNKNQYGSCFTCHWPHGKKNWQIEQISNQANEYQDEQHWSIFEKKGNYECNADGNVSGRIKQCCKAYSGCFWPANETGIREGK